MFVAPFDGAATPLGLVTGGGADSAAATFGGAGCETGAGRGSDTGREGGGVTRASELVTRGADRSAAAEEAMIDVVAIADVGSPTGAKRAPPSDKAADPNAEPLVASAPTIVTSPIITVAALLWRLNVSRAASKTPMKIQKTSRLNRVFMANLGGIDFNPTFTECRFEQLIPPIF